MKKLLIGLLALGSSYSFAKDSICAIEYYQTTHESTLEQYDFNQNINRINLRLSSFPTTISLIIDKDENILGVYRNWSTEIERFQDVLRRDDIKIKQVDLTIYDRNIYGKRFIRILTNGIELDVPNLEDHKFDVKIPIDKKVNLVCQN